MYNYLVDGSVSGDSRGFMPYGFDLIKTKPIEIWLVTKRIGYEITFGYTVNGRFRGIGSYDHFDYDA